MEHALVHADLENFLLVGADYLYGLVTAGRSTDLFSNSSVGKIHRSLLRRVAPFLDGIMSLEAFRSLHPRSIRSLRRSDCDTEREDCRYRLDSDTSLEHLFRILRALGVAIARL